MAKTPREGPYRDRDRAAVHARQLRDDGHCTALPPAAGAAVPTLRASAFVPPARTACTDTRAARSRRAGGAYFTSTLVALDSGAAVLGKCTSSTPSFISALIALASTLPGSVKLRMNDP